VVLAGHLVVRRDLLFIGDLEVGTLVVGDLEVGVLVVGDLEAGVMEVGVLEAGALVFLVVHLLPVVLLPQVEALALVAWMEV